MQTKHVSVCSFLVHGLPKLCLSFLVVMHIDKAFVYLQSLICCSVEQLTGKPAHPFLKRHIFFAHRELKEILDCYEKKVPFYLYTGRVSLPVLATMLLKACTYQRISHKKYIYCQLQQTVLQLT